MSGTILTDLNSLTLTSTAKAAAQARGVDAPNLLALIKTHALELSTLIKQLQNVHPSSGGDSTNFNLLTTLLAELA
jgi:hypothetical protein